MSDPALLHTLGSGFAGKEWSQQIKKHLSQEYFGTLAPVENFTNNPIRVVGFYSRRCRMRFFDDCPIDGSAKEVQPFVPGQEHEQSVRGRGWKDSLW